MKPRVRLAFELVLWPINDEWKVEWSGLLIRDHRSGHRMICGRRGVF